MSTAAGLAIGLASSGSSCGSLPVSDNYTAFAILFVALATLAPAAFHAFHIRDFVETVLVAMIGFCASMVSVTVAPAVFWAISIILNL